MKISPSGTKCHVSARGLVPVNPAGAGSQGQTDLARWSSRRSSMSICVGVVGVVDDVYRGPGSAKINVGRTWPSDSRDLV